MDKNSLSLEPIENVLEQASDLLNWFADEKQLQVWGGPSMRFPLDEKQLCSIGTPNTYGLVDPNRQFLGFGQFYVRLGRHHLSRLAINPAFRGQGIGRRFVTMLMHKATESQQGVGFSLFVDPQNVPAINLYDSLGFQTCPYPDPSEQKFAPYQYMVAIV